jgi:hypothetical protein
MSESPLYMDELCYGIDLRKYDTKELRKTCQINLKWMIDLYNNYPEKDKFFEKYEQANWKYRLFDWCC